MTNPADRIIDLYQRHVREWDEARGRSLFERGWLDRFAALLPPSGSVLDIGCGSGEPIARHLLDQQFAVTGVDSAPAMIDLCRSRLPSASWLVADMRELALGRRFDGLIAWDSFFHLRPEHQRAMFPIFAAHAADNAALMFTSGPAFGEAIGNFEGKALYHASLDPAEYRALLDANGFQVVAHVADDATCGGHTVWLAQRR
jgi:SAM-dependent methyltransferase